MTLPCDPLLLDQIRQAGILSGQDPAGGFACHLDFERPQIAVAIHAGHRVRPELLPFMALSDAERLFEEDEATDVMIRLFPNALWALESRAVYDLNRDEKMALPLTPEKFWGTRVYREVPPPEMNRKSLESHRRFYRHLGTLITYLLDRFDRCVVYDIHSYNITRQQAKGVDDPPSFNLGTRGIDRTKWQQEVEDWLSLLSTIRLPGITPTVAENKVFMGHGELCRRLTDWDSRILVLPTEVSKVYMDELTGKVYPGVTDALASELNRIMNAHFPLKE
ncbi:MAG: N-formylglutamate amidohydrolase [Desulfotignum sp.]